MLWTPPNKASSARWEKPLIDRWAQQKNTTTTKKKRRSFFFFFSGVMMMMVKRPSINTLYCVCIFVSYECFKYGRRGKRMTCILNVNKFLNCIFTVYYNCRFLSVRGKITHVKFWLEVDVPRVVEQCEDSRAARKTWRAGWILRQQLGQYASLVFSREPKGET